MSKTTDEVKFEFFERPPITFRFGDYCLIEQKRYGVPNEKYIHKVIGTLKSNYFVDVPVQCPATETFHQGETVDVVACICCGIHETEVLKYRQSDIYKVIPMIEPPQSDQSKEIEAIANWYKDVTKYGLHIEVLYWALCSMKSNPNQTIFEAFRDGYNEWIK